MSYLTTDAVLSVDVYLTMDAVDVYVTMYAVLSVDVLPNNV